MDKNTDNTQNNLICSAPFEAIEIDHVGDVSFCCACRIDQVFIGNVYKNSFEEIWNSEIAVKYRERLLNNDYSLCNTNICFDLKNQKNTFIAKRQNMQPIMKIPPIRINMGYDFDCNSRCIYCRDKMVKNDLKHYLKLNSMADKTIIPLVKNAKLIVIGSNGECLSSWHSRDLIKKITKINKNILFEILTNGILANEKTFKELNIEDKILAVNVTINASTKKTHEIICRNNNFNKIIKNLSSLSKLRKENKIRIFKMSFVVSDLNYFEIPEFQKLANKYGAEALYWEYREQGIKIHKDYKEHAIHMPTHPEHNKLIEILHNPIFDSAESHYSFNPVLGELRNQKIAT